MKISQVSLAMLVPIIIFGCSAPPPRQGSPTPVVTVTATEAPRLTPTPSGTAGGPVPSVSPQVKVSATPSAVAASSQIIKMDETGVTKVLDCQGQDVVVSGSENHIILHGKVGKLTIQGSTNQISVDNASVVDISGVENRVQWDGKQPEVHNPGNDNRVTELSGPSHAPSHAPSPDLPAPTPLVP